MVSTLNKARKDSNLVSERLSKIVIYAPSATGGPLPANGQHTERQAPQTNFHFITTDNPKQFKDSSIRKSVRSTVMSNFRKTQRAKNDSTTTAVAVASAQHPACNVRNTESSSKSRRGSNQSQIATSVITPAQIQAMLQSDDSTPSIEIEKYLDLPEEEIAYPSVSETDIPWLRRVHSRFHASGAIRMIGTPIDPFRCLPQFSGKINTEALRFHCLAAFPSKTFSESWIPQIIHSKHCYLSAMTIATVHLDILDNCIKDSARTTVIKTESIHLLNAVLQEPPTDFLDGLMRILTVAHLIMAECGDEGKIGLHEKAYRQMIELQGGFESLKAGVLGATMLMVLQLCCIWQEKKMDPDITTFEWNSLPWDWHPKINCESPLYCPIGTFPGLQGDGSFSRPALGVVTLITELVDMVVEKRERSMVQSSSDTNDQPEGKNFAHRCAMLHRRIILLPSATYPSSSTHSDWTYEACRLAALILIIATYHSAPLSEADTIFTHPTYQLLSLRMDTAPTLSVALQAALSRTPTDELWGRSKGVLFWITLVGITASRISHDIHTFTQEALEQSKMMRRYFSSLMNRTVVAMGFECPGPTMLALDRMLTVMLALGKFQEVPAVEEGFYRTDGCRLNATYDLARR